MMCVSGKRSLHEGASALLHVVPFYLGFYVARGTRPSVFPNEHSYIPLDQYLYEQSLCKNLLSLVTRKKTQIQTPTTLSPSSYFILWPCLTHKLPWWASDSFHEMGMDQNLIPPQIWKKKKTFCACAQRNLMFEAYCQTWGSQKPWSFTLNRDHIGCSVGLKRKSSAWGFQQKKKLITKSEGKWGYFQVI